MRPATNRSHGPASGAFGVSGEGLPMRRRTALRSASGLRIPPMPEGTAPMDRWLVRVAVAEARAIRSRFYLDVLGLIVPSDLDDSVRDLCRMIVFGPGLGPKTKG